MANFIITKNQLEYIIKEYSVRGNKKNSRKINEGTANTVASILGIFDPTGLIDFGNGLDLLRQERYVEGLASLISAVPYIGDLVGKPVMFASKLGPTFNKILAMSKSGRQEKAVAELAELMKTNGTVAAFVNKITSLDKDKQIPYSEIIKKAFGSNEFGKSINNWMDLFTQVKSGTNFAKVKQPSKPDFDLKNLFGKKSTETDDPMSDFFDSFKKY